MRTFLKEADGLDLRDDHPILDPFAGTGTTVVESAARGVSAIGVEATPSLAFVAAAKGVRNFPPLPDLDGCDSCEDFAARLVEPVHRAALICAEAARHTSDGSPNRGAAPLAEMFAQTCATVAEDLAQPLKTPVNVRQGDARVLSECRDASIAGVLTSPPYLSRHDYTRVTRPHERVFRLWYDVPPLAAARQTQVRAHPRAHAQDWSPDVLPSVQETVNLLHALGSPKLGGVVRSYVEDMTATLAALRRVLVPAAPCWLVVGGARLEHVYVPADLMLAEQAEAIGFAVEAIWSVRRLIPSGRKLGGLSDVAPRESVLCLRSR